MQYDTDKLPLLVVPCASHGPGFLLKLKQPQARRLHRNSPIWKDLLKPTGLA